jgi:hypothetical protein
MVTNQIVDQLIATGENGVPFVPAALEDERQAALLLHGAGRNAWQTVGLALDEAALRNLIRGVILYSRCGRKTGGSVSPVIDLYRIYAERFPTQEPLLTGWIVDNRTNEYEPFGSTISNNERTLSEYVAERLARERRGAENSAAQEERQRIAAAEKRRREAKKSTQRLPNAVRRGDTNTVINLLGKGADPKMAVVPDGGSLVDLALQNGHSPLAALLRSRGIR